MTLTNHPVMVCGTGTGIADCSDQTLYHNHSPYYPKNQSSLCDTALSCSGATLLPHGSPTGFDVSTHDNAGDLRYESVVALRLVVCIYNIGCFFSDDGNTLPPTCFLVLRVHVSNTRYIPLCSFKQHRQSYHKSENLSIVTLVKGVYSKVRKGTSIPSPV